MPQLPADRRLASLDLTRGVAVMGILAANIVAFGQPFIAYTWPGGFATPPGTADPWLWAAQFVVIDGKMRGLFSLLFGAGMALFAERAAARGQGDLLQLRRLAWLFAFGLLHFYFLWRGDILASYAVCGLLVLPMLRWSPVTQIGAAMTGYLFGAVSSALVFGGWWASGTDRAGPASEHLDAQRETAIAHGGGYVEYVTHAFAAHRWDWLDGISQSFTETVPLMLLGAALYRLGLFDGRIDRCAQARWALAAVVIGSVLTVLIAAWAMRDGLSYTGTLLAQYGLQPVARLPVIVGFAALLAPWRPKSGAWFAPRVAAAGRMAFSNYIFTSVVMLLVFQALGLFGRLDRMALYGIVMVTCVAMLGWSQPWLARFRYGPLEWLWRSLTYGKRMPMRKQA
ncbi:DUF418 domain-containing protein [Altererythrobacter aerius]|uniref:DUF418 domain-containing protein n=2 Tax=Tsuneonella aeria TaxID=1837929 RepID=A0A6I4TES9_9SPHN|nr:DUF418 domain-containing protein [Tsuneonella aeria]MXO74685.1 DUF418 domain-containing protein [Tsuneonella aeria]